MNMVHTMWKFSLRLFLSITVAGALSITARAQAPSATPPPSTVTAPGTQVAPAAADLSYRAAMLTDVRLVEKTGGRSGTFRR